MSRITSRRVLWLGPLLLLLACGGEKGGSGDAAQMNQEVKPGSAPHLGQLAPAAPYEFEVVFLPAGIRVYTYRTGLLPVPAAGMQGSATLAFADGRQEQVALQYVDGDWVGSGNDQTKTHDYLLAPLDLRGVQAGSLTVGFDVWKSAGGPEDSLAFAVVYEGMVEAPYVCPMCPDGWGATAKSRCAICGMYTSASRPAPAGSGGERAKGSS